MKSSTQPTRPESGAGPPGSRLPLLALLGANTISEIGSRLTLIALPWFVLQTTGSAARTGLTGFAVAFPGFLVGIFGGAFVDRLGYRRTSVIADTVSAIGIGLVPALYYLHSLRFGLLLAFVFIGSLLEIPGLTARRSMLPELAAQAGQSLERINATFESIQHLSLLLGPPLAGLLIVWLRAPAVLWIDAATFAVSAVVVRLAVPAFRLAAGGAREPYLASLLTGLRFLAGDPLLRAMAVTLALGNAISAPLVAVVLPVFAERVFGSAADLGLMFSALGAGSLVGATVYGAIGPRLSRRTLWFGCYLLMPLVFWVLLARPSLPLLLAGVALEGIITGPVSPLMVTIRHERIPAPLRGRVFSTYSAISQLASPFGIVLGGLTISALGFRPTLLILAVCYQALAPAMFAIPALRRMDTAAPRVEAGGRV